MVSRDARTSAKASHSMAKAGMSYVAIAEPLEVHRNTVSNGWRAYQAEGAGGIQSQTREGVSLASRER